METSEYLAHGFALEIKHRDQMQLTMVYELWPTLRLKSILLKIVF